MNTAQTILGQGVYTAADASRILKIPYPKAKYWFAYYAKKKLHNSIGHQYHFPVKDIVAVNFLTLIEMYVFFTLKEKGLKTTKIMAAHTAMAKHLKTPYPFANENLYVDGLGLLFGDESLLLSADKKLQAKIAGVLLPFCQKVQFTNQRLAHKYYPLGQSKAIVVTPDNQFGQPIIDGTNILTATIYAFHKGGESNDSISRLYDISPDNVRDAIEYHMAA